MRRLYLLPGLLSSAMLLTASPPLSSAADSGCPFAIEDYPISVTVDADSEDNEFTFFVHNEANYTSFFTSNATTTGNLSVASISPPSFTLGPDEIIDVQVFVDAGSAGTGRVEFKALHYLCTYDHGGPGTNVTIQ